ncbi:DUF362 domain-containing protein [bacterium]|nr:DUF362 domain-containing protein [bacterium]
MDRRQFIKISGGAAALLAAGLGSCGNSRESDTSDAAETGVSAKSKVAVHQNPELTADNHRLEKRDFQRLLENTLNTLFDVQDYREGLRELFKPQDIVGIKVNCLSGRMMSTHLQSALSMAEMLAQIGIPRENIILWDRSDADLKYAGYPKNTKRGDIQIYGADTAGYQRELTIHRSIGSFTTRILDKVTAMVNLPVLKDHGIVGVTLSLKNFFGAIHNPNKYHPNSGNPYVADLYSLPVIKDKVRLTVIDGLKGQYEGGPPGQPQWQWNFGGLLASTDPAALDAIGLDIIEAKRAEKGFPSLSEAGRFPEYLKTAELLGIGNFSRDKIKIVRS